MPRAKDPLVNMPSTLEAILVVGHNPITVRTFSTFFKSDRSAVLTATNRVEALQLAEHPLLRAAVLDADLAPDDRTAICRRLLERGVPFFFFGQPGGGQFQFWPFPSPSRTETEAGGVPALP